MSEAVEFSSPVRHPVWVSEDTQTLGHWTCPTTWALRATLTVLGPASLALAPTFAWVGIGPAQVAATLLSPALLLAAAFVHHPHRVAGRLLATLGALWWATHILIDLVDEPARGFGVLLATVFLLSQVWLPERLRLDRIGREGALSNRADVATVVVVLVGLEVWWRTTPTLAWLTAAGLAGQYFAHVVIDDLRRRRRQPWLTAVAGLLALLPLLGPLAAPHGSSWGAAGLASPVVLVAMRWWLRRRRRERPTPAASRTAWLFDLVLARPSRALVLSFAGISAVGALLLRLPTSTHGRLELSWVDAVFTSVSATCVTGLIVVDTPVAFGGFGQLVLLLLIEVGGLGIMVFSSGVALLAGRRLSLAHEQAAVELMGADRHAGLSEVLKQVLLVSAATQLLATLSLTVGFVARGETLASALWRALFTAVSAFCNAGFALQSDSLIGYADDPFILLVVSATIVVGGLGPLVVMASLRRGALKQRSLHVKLVWASTVLLVVVPGLFITATEWSGFLAEHTVLDKFTNGMFQSITLRTAGFNSVDLARLQPATWAIMLLVMFIGGSPGSTAGGVKTTTIAVLLMAVASAVRGRHDVAAYGRRVPTELVLRAAAILTLGILTGFFTLLAILLTQPTLPVELALYEVVSAASTVGLSMGATGQLDDVGKVIIIFAMFLGRIGPISLFIFFSTSARAQRSGALVEETVPIG